MNYEKPYVSADELVERINKYHPNCDGSIIRRAYAFSEKAHEGKKRLSGEPYFMHPVAVAVILIDLMLDESTVAAGLLHDCVEDVDGVTVEGITAEFGEEVALMVDGVTKLRKLDFTSREEAQAASLRKMMLAMAKDIRVVLIKLADRLHNMRTLKTQRKERQVPIAQETLDIYAPLAHRLGVYTIKWELEDLSLRYIDPEAYADLVKKVGMTRAERERLITNVTQELSAQLRLHNIKCEIEGRPKHFYSIYKKMKSQNKTFDQIYDLIAVRVLVDTLPECYYALGIVHTLWPQIPGRFKDYISMPKANNYKSLHTTVVNAGKPFEVQIRTFEMHRIAEYGIAAHWRYKEGNQADELDERLSWLRNLIASHNDSQDPNDFNEAIKSDLFADEVIVFTPKGDVVSLPRGSTPIDFAYRIHTAVGNRCIGAKVDGRMVTLGYTLETGEFVEVITSQNSKGPSLDWLNFVKTSEAKSKIKASLKKQSRDVNIQRGKEMLEKEAVKQGYTLPELTKKEYLEAIYKRYTFTTMDDVCSAIGFGGISAPQIVNRLVEEYKKEHKPEIVPIQTFVKDEKKGGSGQALSIIMHGQRGLQGSRVQCCSPVPGDDIVGFMSRTHGIIIHKANCPNVTGKGVEKERLVTDIQWDYEARSSHIASISVVCLNRNGMLAELSSYFANLNISVQTINAHPHKKLEGMSEITMSIEISDTNEINKILRELNAKKDVYDAKRSN